MTKPCPDCGEPAYFLDGVHQIRGKKVVNGFEQRMELDVEDTMYCAECGWFEMVREPVETETPPNLEQNAYDMGHNLANMVDTTQNIFSQVSTMLQKQSEIFNKISESGTQLLQPFSGADDRVQPSALVRERIHGDGTWEYGFPDGRTDDLAVRFKQTGDTWYVEVYLGSGKFDGYGKSPGGAMKNCITSVRTWLTGLADELKEQLAD